MLRILRLIVFNINLITKPLKITILKSYQLLNLLPLFGIKCNL